MLDGAATQNEHSLAESFYFRDITLHSFDDDGSRHSVQYLPVTLAVGMSVIPEQARRMIARNLNRVVQSLARPRHHSDYVILGRVRGNSEPVKMQVRHVHARVDRTGLRGLGGKIVAVRDFEDVPWGRTDHRCHILTVESESVPAVVIHCAQREGYNMVLRLHLRRLCQRHRLGAQVTDWNENSDEQQKREEETKSPILNPKRKHPRLLLVPHRPPHLVLSAG